MVTMARCLKPIKLKTGDIVPCGNCPACKAARASAWSFRLLNEEKRSDSAYFVTLTYDSTNVPLSRNGYLTLDKRDVQLFFKRLRKAHPSGNSIKYYLAGEYGGRSFRPHYHVILFNADVAKIFPAWDKGDVHFGAVEGASVGYTLKYVSKPKRIPMHRNDDRIPEFGLMSKRLGRNYLSSAMVNWHKADLENRMCCVLEGGQKIAMPRYYKNILYTEMEKEQIILALNQKFADETILQSMSDNDPGGTYRDYQEAVKYAFVRSIFQHQNHGSL